MKNKGLSNLEAKYVRLRAAANRALDDYLKSGSHVDYQWMAAAFKVVREVAVEVADAVVDPMPEPRIRRPKHARRTS